MSPEEALAAATAVYRLSAAIFMALESLETVQDGEPDGVLLMRALGNVVGLIASSSDNPAAAMQTFNKFAAAAQADSKLN